MKKTHMASALGLAVVLTLVGASQSLALEIESYNDDRVILGEVSRSAELEKVMCEARIAREIARQNPSVIYPGLVKYIDGLLEIAESGNFQDEAELIAALDDVAFATPLLLGVKTVKTNDAVEKKNDDMPVVTQVSAEVGEKSLTSNATLAKTSGIDTKMQLATIVRTGAEQDREAESLSDDATLFENEELDDEGAVEVPHTGEDELKHKAGVGELIIAGAAVMLATIGGVAFVIYNKKNN